MPDEVFELPQQEGQELNPEPIVDRLRRFSRLNADKIAFTFLPNGENNTGEINLSYSELDRRARQVAAELRKHEAQGKPVLVILPSGIEFIVALYGCLYAGAIAVPTPAPNLARAARTLPRLQSILVDSGARLVLTNAELAARSHEIEANAPKFKGCTWLPTDSLLEGFADAFDFVARPDSPAYLQYTSGSTGEPKGVVVSHGNLTANSEMLRNAWGRIPGSVMVSWVPLFHDLGLIWNVIQTVYCGGHSVFMPPEAFIQEPLRWLRAISHYRGTLSGGPNFAFDYCVRRIGADDRAKLDLSSWQVAMVGSEPVRHQTLERFASVFADCGFRQNAFRPAYGLAEATLMVTGGELDAPLGVARLDADALENNEIKIADANAVARVLVGQGQPRDDLRAEVVDPESHEPVAPDRIGEIWLSGPSVSSGYWHRPEESQETFGARLSSDNHQTFLRTGDLGFFHDDELYITGRLKDLIIIRGRNHYPQDIEFSCDSVHAAVRPGCSATFSIEHDNEEKLVVVQEVNVVEGLEPKEVLQLIRRQIIAEHDVAPHAVVLVKARSIPKTSSGKIQRRLCRNQFLSSELAIVAEWSEPSTADQTTEQDSSGLDTSAIESLLVERLAGICGLDVDEIDPDEQFDSYGLDSARAIGLAVELGDWLNRRISNRLTWEHPTPRSLALALSAQVSSHEFRMIEPDPIPPLQRDAEEVHRFPLAPAQAGLWFLDQLHSNTAAYNVPIAFRLHGALDLDKLKAAVRELGSRHETTRTRFASELTTHAQIVESVSTLELGFQDLQNLNIDQRDETARVIAAQESSTPFDLGQAPLLRVRAVRFAEDDHLLLLTMHHIVSDAESMHVLVRELFQLYAGDDLEALPIQYADFARWHEGRLDNLIAPQREYWLEKLSGMETLELPSDYPSASGESLGGAAVFFEVPNHVREGLAEIAKQQGVSLFMSVVAALKTLLHRYSGQCDITIGAPVSTRRNSEVRESVGFFVNTLVLRTDLANDPSFRDLLERVRETCLDAYAHQDVPIDRLVADLQRAHDGGRDPVVRVGVGMNRAFDSQDFDRFGLAADRLLVDGGGCIFDLNLLFFENNGELQGKLEYSTDLFEDATAERMARHFQTLLESIVAAPDCALSDLELFTSAERNSHVASLYGRPLPLAEPTWIDAFEKQVITAPDAIAVEDATQSLTYAELDGRANAVAHYLDRLGIDTETTVGIGVERSVDMLVALLAVLKSGGAYVPLDPSFPSDRLAFMVKDCGAEILITQKQNRAVFASSSAGEVLDLDAIMLAAADFPTTAPHRSIGGENLAYVLYTSGSTGRPKGVEIEHRALLNFLRSMQAEPGLRDNDALLAITSLSFDISGLELFLPLITGARVVIADSETVRDPQLLARALLQHGVSVMQATPSVWRMLVDSGWTGHPSLRVLCGGEALPLDLAEWLTQNCGEVWNLYGPTETTIWSTVKRVETGSTYISLGAPIAETQLLILSPKQQPVPVGATGEIYIGGAGLARGYRGQPELTQQRFVPHPFKPNSKERLYRTGDLARLRNDGGVEFLGRTDHQVKIRGHRIELGEIESLLLRHDQIRDAVVVGRKDSTGTDALVAYVVGTLDAPDELRGYLAEALPAYMIPSQFISLEALPLTPNRKVDRKALPAPTERRRSHNSSPMSTLEKKLASIWEGVLGLEGIGSDDDFFALGGHSLLATRVTALVRSTLQVDLPVRSLFDAPTISELAKWIERTEASVVSKTIAIIDRGGELPLSYAQERVWFLETLLEGLPTYNVPAAFHVAGSFDCGAFDGALQDVVDRHEVLRCSVHLDEGRLVQAIADSLEASCSVVDFENLPESERTDAARRKIEFECRKSFNLAEGPLLRATVARISAAEHWIGISCHHLASDAVSMDILIRELSAFYAARLDGIDAAMNDLPIQYVDFAAWQRHSLSSNDQERQLSYWRHRLDQVSPLDLASDRPRPSRQSFRGGTFHFSIPQELVERLVALSRNNGSTLFMTLLSVFNLFLRRHSGQNDIAVATPLLNRSRAEVENLIGLFLNTLVLRNELSMASSFSDLVKQVRRTCIEAYENQDVPFEQVVAKVATHRDPARNPLAQVCFTLQEIEPQLFTLPNAEATLVDVEMGTAKFDLSFIAKTEADGLEAVFEYNTDLFDLATMERWSQSLLQLIDQVTANPDTPLHMHSSLMPTDHQQIFPEFVPAPSPTLHHPASLTVLEEKLAKIWSEVLQLENIGIHEDFFALGGHSLLATRVTALVRSTLQIDLPVRSLFDAPTISKLAKWIEHIDSSAGSAPIAIIDRGGELPLSHAQERIWFLETLMEGLPTYNVPTAFHVMGPLDCAAFHGALQDVVDHHEALRSSVALKEGRLLQVIADSLQVDCSIVDFEHLPETERTDAARKSIEFECRKPFNLAEGPLLRATVAQVSNTEHWVGLTCHHLISDAVSMDNLMSELSRSYTARLDGKTADVPDLPIQYADFAAWQRNSLPSEEQERQLAYWRRRLNQVPPLDLASDRPRPSLQSFRGSMFHFSIPQELVERLVALSHNNSSTLFMTLLSVFSLFLKHHSGQNDVAVATPLLNRSRSEVENLIGLFLNTLVLRNKLSMTSSFQDFAKQVRQTCIEAYENQDVPFEQVVAETTAYRDLARNPLAQVAFTLQGVEPERLNLPQTQATPVDIEMGTAKFDLSFIARAKADGLEAAFEYNTDLFDLATMERWSHSLLHLIDQVTANPNAQLHAYSSLNPVDRKQILVGVNETKRRVPDATVVTRFMEQALLSPDVTAVRCGGASLTYRELDELSSLLTCELQTRGVKRGDRVGLCLERSVELLIGIYGILKAGAAYVPLDPRLPTQRLTYMIRDSGTAVCVTQTSCSSVLDSDDLELVCLDTPFDSDHGTQSMTGYLDPGDLAYIIYTSGSTGTPKGVEIEHRSLLNLMLGMIESPGIYRDDVWVSVAPVSFDLSVPDLFGPLMVGAKLVLASDEESSDGLQLSALLNRVRATVLPATPATWRLLLAANWHGSGSLRAICGGDALALELAHEIVARAGRLFNFYGPTESTVWASAVEVTQQTDEISIGRPLANTSLYVLDEDLLPVPIGVPGELCIGGMGLARGYHNLNKLTRERFVACNTAVGIERLYRTGDQVRYRADRSLEYLGRLDHQVKVRGYRIECGEIENCLMEHPAVKDVAVVAKRDSSGENRLVAYWVADPAYEDTPDLHSRAKEQLPGYMVPSLIVQLEALPLSHNSKVDRNALRTMTDESRAIGVAYKQPRSDFECWLSVQWERLLGTKTLGIDTNVFDLGATSLMAATVQAKISDKLARTFPMAAMFRYPTIRSLSDHLLAEDAAESNAEHRPTTRKESLRELGRLRRNRRRQRSET